MQVSEDLMLELERLRRIRSAFSLGLDFQPGASNEEIDRIEQATGIRLDDCLKSLWNLSNGSGDLCWFVDGDEDGIIVADELTPFSFLSLTDAFEFWSSFLPYDEKTYQEWFYDGTSGKRNPRIQPHYLRHRLWFPFADFGGGNQTVQFDADPAARGHYGQIIMFCHDPDVIDYVCKNFLDFFRRSNSILESALESLDDDLDSIKEWLHW